MTTIITRAGKGSPLTNNEMDTNLTNLNTDKAEKNNPVFTGTVTSPQYYNVTNSYGALRVNGVDAVRFDSSGIRPKADQIPSFAVWSNISTNSTSAGTVPIPFNMVEYDTDGSWDTVNYRYIAKVAGVFEFKARVQFVTAPTNCYVILYKNGVEFKYGVTYMGASCDIACDISLSVGDMVGLAMWSNITTANYAGQQLCYASGRLVRPASL